MKFVVDDKLLNGLIKILQELPFKTVYQELNAIMSLKPEPEAPAKMPKADIKTEVKV